MGILERRIRQKEEVKAAILHAAWKLVLADGWQSLSIRKIADAIEYSIPVIYDHFENKEAILLEFSKDGFKALVETITVTKSKYDKPCEQLDAIAFAYWDFAFDNKEYYQLMFGLGIPTCDTTSKIPAMGDFNAVITSSIVGMVAPGKKPAFDPWLKYQSFWSMLHGLVSINMVSPSRAEQPGQGHEGHKALPQQVLEDVMCSFIRGIEAAEAARPD